MVFHSQLQHKHMQCSSLIPTNPASVFTCNNYWRSWHNFRNLHTDYQKILFIQKWLQSAEISFLSRDLPRWKFSVSVLQSMHLYKIPVQTANPLKSLSAWDLSGSFLHGICMKLMACLQHTHHGTAFHRCCSPKLQGSLTVSPQHSFTALDGCPLGAAVQHCTRMLCPCTTGTVQGTSHDSHTSWDWTPRVVFKVLPSLLCTK